jgi:glutathionyl-hydroquinone reductase
VRSSSSDGVDELGAINKVMYKVEDNILYRNFSPYLNAPYEKQALAIISDLEELEIKVLFDRNEYLTWPPFNEADLKIYPTLMEINIKFSDGNFEKILFISGDDFVG